MASHRVGRHSSRRGEQRRPIDSMSRSRSRHERPCKFFNMGSCRDGVDCRYPHYFQQCAYFAGKSKSCVKGDRCEFAHLQPLEILQYSRIGLVKKVDPSKFKKCPNPGCYNPCIGIQCAKCHRQGVIPPTHNRTVNIHNRTVRIIRTNRIIPEPRSRSRSRLRSRTRSRTKSRSRRTRTRTKSKSSSSSRSRTMSKSKSRSKSPEIQTKLSKLTLNKQEDRIKEEGEI